MSPRKPSEARQRIIATADRLFYAEGIRAVGIDRVIAEAEVAKMTLYKHFPSKDDLVLEVLKFREAWLTDFFVASMEKHGKKGKAPLEAFFGALKDWFRSPGFRGCVFINTMAELADPAHQACQFVREHKQRFHRMVRDILEDVLGHKNPKLARAINVMIEGAIVSAMIEGKPSAVDACAEATMSLVAHET